MVAPVSTGKMVDKSSAHIKNYGLMFVFVSINGKKTQKQTAKSRSRAAVDTRPPPVDWCAWHAHQAAQSAKLVMLLPTCRLPDFHIPYFMSVRMNVNSSMSMSMKNHGWNVFYSILRCDSTRSILVSFWLLACLASIELPLNSAPGALGCAIHIWITKITFAVCFGGGEKRAYFMRKHEVQWIGSAANWREYPFIWSRGRTKSPHLPIHHASFSWTSNFLIVHHPTIDRWMDDEDH